MKETFYHVTVLSNFARGFDKYSRSYDKARIPESTFPDRFFLLRRPELNIGVYKAVGLMGKLDLEGNRLIALETEVDNGVLRPNLRNGCGHYIESNRIAVKRVHELGGRDASDVQLTPFEIEDAVAASLRLLNRQLLPYERIRPRAISFLPVALACQAKCPFCFSKASVSSDQLAAKLDWEKVDAWLKAAHTQGAERAVITGGGEPTLLRQESLVRLIGACAGNFEKVVLITNGHTIALADPGPAAKFQELYEAGLKVLAISRHHENGGANRRLMQLDTPIEPLAQMWRTGRKQWPELRLRLICVLQKGGVEDEAALESYIAWAAKLGVEEICFKELYVSTSAESVYHDRKANEWSRRHQVPLSIVTSFADRQGFEVESRLPWDAPVYRGEWGGQQMRIAAYTEPSLFWERSRGIARSWNIMADGRCHVSLEDRASEISLEAAA